MMDLRNILTWRQNFGHLPIHLLPIHKDETSYILLNGGNADFCLKTKDDKSPEKYYSLAWSSNTKNFLVLNDEKIIVYNWKKNKAETINKKNFEENIDKVYTYLVNSSYKSDEDIIPFIIDIFKQFRHLTKERNNATDALNLLLILLASLEVSNLSEINYEEWGLSKIDIPNDFDIHISKLKSALPKITPESDVIIRHASGLLFQEAQKEVLFFSGQLDVFGGFSSNINSKSIPYSSLHYTPPYLARIIVENTITNLNDTKKH